MNVLIVLTSHDTLGTTGRKTGFWLEELAAPYYAFKDAGARLVLDCRRSTPRAMSRPSKPS
jgi:putative intracellular protease/amidase